MKIIVLKHLNAYICASYLSWKLKDYKLAYQNKTGIGVEKKKNNIHRTIAVGLVSNININIFGISADNIQIMPDYDSARGNYIETSKPE